ncbi:hypothetical protein NSMS1_08210 [Nostoc sp. MS1]|nr:hypothetical protein NSMS1_08210 [Nostoc sp. MS1]
MVKQRLDTLLVELNLCNSRALAQRLIQAGEVTVNQQVIDKPGTEVDVAAEIKIKERCLRLAYAYAPLNTAKTQNLKWTIFSTMINTQN